jgi:hypothetical protein
MREPPKVTRMLPSKKRATLSREKIDRVQRGDDLTTDNQFLEIVAIAQFFVRQNAEPEILGKGPSGVRFDDSRIKHVLLFKQRTCQGGVRVIRNRNSPIGNGRWVANGTRTRNSQNHNLELYH